MRVGIWISLSVVLASISGASTGNTTSVEGYLAPDELDVSRIIEPAPQRGDPRYESDRKIFRQTRALIGTPRWALATRDAKLDTASMLRTYSCAIGVTLTPENAPKLTRVAERAWIDTSNQIERAKAFYRRNRPYTIDNGTICQPRSQLYDVKAQRISYDYPSGHTTRGWTWALILASIAPDRAQQILERGRAYGDSRFVCGAHNESAVEAGMLSASATMALVATKPLYQADLAEARVELADLKVRGAVPQKCKAEVNLIRLRVMPIVRPSP